jgi:hypothetical protein
MKNYYQIMGISQTAGELEIRKAYRRLVRQYHPDINSSPEAPEQFRAVQEAYEVLMDSDMAPMITASILASSYGLKPRLANMKIGYGIPLSFITLYFWYWWVM